MEEECEKGIEEEIEELIKEQIEEEDINLFKCAERERILG